MADFTARHVDPRPIWSADTDEVQVAYTVAGQIQSITIPDYCYAILVSTNGQQGTNPSMTMAVASSAGTGIHFGGSTYDCIPRAVRVKPGTVIYFENVSAGAISLNVVRFYNKPAA